MFAAEQFWESNGVSASAFANVNVTTGTLPSGVAGQTTGNQITLSADGAGYGWHVDPNPAAGADFLPTRARPNAVHLITFTAQFCRIFKTSLPLRGGCCFVRRFTTRGLDRPLALVRPPVAASLTNALHHFWNCSGGNGAAGGKFTANQCQAVLETECVRRSLSRQRGLQYQFAYDMVR